MCRVTVRSVVRRLRAIGDEAQETQPTSPLGLPHRRCRMCGDRGCVGGEFPVVVSRVLGETVCVIGSLRGVDVEGRNARGQRENPARIPRIHIASEGTFVRDVARLSHVVASPDHDDSDVPRVATTTQVPAGPLPQVRLRSNGQRDGRVQRVRKGDRIAREVIQRHEFPNNDKFGNRNSLTTGG